MGRSKTTFKKGEGGRKKGVKNKSTLEIQSFVERILEAIDNRGLQGIVNDSPPSVVMNFICKIANNEKLVDALKVGPDRLQLAIEALSKRLKKK
jgi:hypothetical protein